MLHSWVRCTSAIAVLALGALAIAPAAEPLKVGVEPNAEPLSFIDTSGRPTGFAIELLREVARTEQLTLQFVVAPWSQVLDDLRAGRLDLLANVAYTTERDVFIDFAVAHIDMRAAIFVNRHGPRPASLDELARLRVGASFRSLSHEYVVKRGWDRRLQNFDTLDAGLRAVDRGECDALIATQLIGTKIARDLRLRNVTTADLELPDLTYQLHFGVRAGNADLLYRLNRGLARARADGAYDQLYEKWIGPLEPRRLRLKDVRLYLVGLGVLAVAIAGAFVWQRRLLVRLARQTEQLRRGEERLQLVLEGSQDAFWDWDMVANRFERSERWAAMLGYTLDEITANQEGGKSLIHPDDLPEYNTWLPRLRAGEDRYDIEYRMKSKSGEWRWIHDRGKVVARDAAGRPLRMAGTHTDITERKRTEAALIESRELAKRAAQLLEQTQSIAHIGGWEVDLRTDQLYWSEETFRLHDTTPADYRPTVETAITFYTPESRAIITAAVENAVRHGTPYDLELELVTAKGRRIRVHTTGRAISEHGHVVKIYGSFRDITAEKQAEEERKKLHLKMLEAQKLESLGVLAGGIAHDFNNLLTVILANATFARDDAGGGGDPRLAHIETAARRAADLCRQMLAYAGRGTFLVERIDLGQLVKDTAQLLQVSISKKARLAVSLAPGLPAVQADASQLRQVVMNLVINASEALGDVPGEIRLTTHLARPELPPGGIMHSFDLPAGACVCLEIADTGHGMSPATLARVFDPFFTTKFAGRGLGLAAVLGIVRAHHGALTVESAVGAGTTFRLFLPATSEAPKPAAPPAAAQPPRGAGATILLVDDEPVVLATADALLRHAGYKTVLAADGHEAVHQFRANPRGFDAVALDLTMPGLDGSEVLRIMRALNPDVRVLIMSGFSEQDVLTRVRGQSAVPVLRKPFTHETLLAKIAETING